MKLHGLGDYGSTDTTSTGVDMTGFYSSPTGTSGSLTDALTGPVVLPNTVLPTDANAALTSALVGPTALPVDTVTTDATSASLTSVAAGAGNIFTSIANMFKPKTTASTGAFGTTASGSMTPILILGAIALVLMNKRK